MAFYSNALDFPNLTVKSTPTTSDILMIADAAASNVPKQVTIGSLPFAPLAGGTVVNVTGSTQAMVIDATYVVNYTGGVCTLTLPATAAQGSFIQIIGGESISNAYVIAQNASQSIRMTDQITTVGATGTLTAANKFNTLKLVCDDASGNNAWSVVNCMGSFAGA